MKSKMVIAVFLVLAAVSYLVGCSKETTTATGNQTETTEEKSINIPIDTSEVKISKGLELVGVTLEDKSGMLNIVGSVKNNTNNTCTVRLSAKLYDQTDSLLDTRGDTGNQISPGETWKTQIFYHNKNNLSKIKITDVSILGSGSSSSEGANKSPESNHQDVVVNSAKTLISKSIKTPGSAQWVSAEVLDNDSYGRYLVDVVVDAQNDFGALIRSGFIVVLQSVSEDGHFTHSSMFPLEEYKKDSERERVIENTKKLNHWNEPNKEQ